MQHLQTLFYFFHVFTFLTFTIFTSTFYIYWKVIDSLHFGGQITPKTALFWQRTPVRPTPERSVET